MPRLQRRGRNFYGKHYPWIGGGGGGGGGGGLVPAFVTGAGVIAVQAQSIPALRTPIDVLGFGGTVGGTVPAKIERITDETMLTEDATLDDQKRRVGGRYEYGKEPFTTLDNARMAMLNVGGANRGFSENRTISTGAKNFSNIPKSGRNDNCLVTSPLNANKATYFFDNELREYDFSTGVSTLIKAENDPTATAYFQISDGQEGRPDNAHTKRASIGQRGDGKRDVLLHRLSDGALLGRRADPLPFFPDNCTVSPLGNYVHVMPQSQGTGEFNEIWDATSGTLVLVRQLFKDATHADWALGKDGKEYLVYDAVTTDEVIPFSGARVIAKARADNGAISSVLAFPEDDYSHSVWICGAISRTWPGWVVVATQDQRLEPHYVYSNEIFLLNFETSEVRRIAHHHSIQPKGSDGSFGNLYWREPHICCSWDGTYIYFCSGWDIISTKVLSLSRTGTLVTVTDVAHGYSTGAIVYLNEPDPIAFKDGLQIQVIGFGTESGPITVTDADHYTYNTSTSGALTGTAFKASRGIWTPLAAYRLSAPAGAYLLKAGD